ncbi:MAG: Lrp/AsnC family transcriptional regulator [Deltaproteobacteria bacterium]|nr:Lrp/AsnC family transcriptional regulator [Deltaproteobacteria bacterium]
MIDEIDAKILQILQTDGRISNVDIARTLGMAPSGVLARRRRLEREGIIQGYEARVDPRPLGLGLMTFIQVKTDEPVGQTGAGREMAALSEIQEVHFIAGEFNYLLKARVTGTDGLTRLLERMGAISTVRDTRTTLVLDTIKEGLALGFGEPGTRPQGSRRKSSGTQD